MMHQDSEKGRTVSSGDSGIFLELAQGPPVILLLCMFQNVRR